MSAHISFNPNSTYGILLRTAMGSLETGLVKANEVLGTMTEMLDGDGSSDTHYTYITSKFGFTDNAVAHAGYAELSALVGKLNTDGSITNMHAALIQAFNRFK